MAAAPRAAPPRPPGRAPRQLVVAAVLGQQVARYWARRRWSPAPAARGASATACRMHGQTLGHRGQAARALAQLDLRVGQHAPVAAAAGSRPRPPGGGPGGVGIVAQHLHHRAAASTGRGRGSAGSSPPAMASTAGHPIEQARGPRPGCPGRRSEMSTSPSAAHVGGALVGRRIDGQQRRPRVGVDRLAHLPEVQADVDARGEAEGLLGVAGGQQRQRLVAGGVAGGELVAEEAGRGLDAAQDAQLLPGRAAGQRRAPPGRWPLARSLRRKACSAAAIRCRTARAGSVPRSWCEAITAGSSPRASRSRAAAVVRRGQLLGGAQAVGGVAHQRVAEAPARRPCPRRPAARGSRGAEGGQGGLQLVGGCRRRAAGPPPRPAGKLLAEHAGRAQHPPGGRRPTGRCGPATWPARCRGWRRGGPRRRGSALRGRARCPPRGSTIRSTLSSPMLAAQHLADQAGGGRRAQRLQRHGGQPGRPQVGEQLLHLGPPQRQHHEAATRPARAGRPPPGRWCGRRSTADRRAPAPPGRRAASARRKVSQAWVSRSAMMPGLCWAARSSGKVSAGIGQATQLGQETSTSCAGQRSRRSPRPR